MADRPRCQTWSPPVVSRDLLCGYEGREVSTECLSMEQGQDIYAQDLKTSMNPQRWTGHQILSGEVIG